MIIINNDIFSTWIKLVVSEQHQPATFFIQNSFLSEYSLLQIIFLVFRMYHRITVAIWTAIYGMLHKNNRNFKNRAQNRIDIHGVLRSRQDTIVSNVSRWLTNPCNRNQSLGTSSYRRVKHDFTLSAHGCRLWYRFQFHGYNGICSFLNFWIKGFGVNWWMFKWGGQGALSIFTASIDPTQYSNCAIHRSK